MFILHKVRISQYEIINHTDYKLTYVKFLQQKALVSNLQIRDNDSFFPLASGMDILSYKYVHTCKSPFIFNDR